MYMMIQLKQADIIINISIVYNKAEQRQHDWTDGYHMAAQCFNLIELADF